MTPLTHREFLLDTVSAGINACKASVRLPDYLPAGAPEGKTIVLGAGKAAGDMAAVVSRQIEGPVTGLVVTRYGHAPDEDTGAIRVIEGAHPLPDSQSLKAALSMLDLAGSAGPEDRVIFLISGGGSALISCPAEGVSPAEKRALNLALVRSGAAISDINLVRTHLSKVKGGRLAAAAYPAGIYTYIISDVVGDDPAMVASGPTIARPHQPDRALEILRANKIDVSPAVKAAIRMPPPLMDTTHPVEIIATADHAIDAIVDHLAQSGWSPHVAGRDLEGDAAALGASHADLARTYLTKPGRHALVSGGELTVTVRHDEGCGGPNLEYLTGLMVGLDGAQGIEAIACDSDGIDGSEDNAGGYFNADIFARAHRENICPKTLLERNATYSLFAQMDGLVMTGPTRTNVNDLRVILIEGVKT